MGSNRANGQVMKQRCDCMFTQLFLLHQQVCIITKFQNEECAMQEMSDASDLDGEEEVDREVEVIGAPNHSERAAGLLHGVLS